MIASKFRKAKSPRYTIERGYSPPLDFPIPMHKITVYIMVVDTIDTLKAVNM